MSFKFNYSPFFDKYFSKAFVLNIFDTTDIKNKMNGKLIITFNFKAHVKNSETQCDYE